MRKLISLGLLALLLSSLSGSVLAEPADGACELLVELNASPGLYGLCIAYHNANEKARERIINNYNKHKQPSDPDMPGVEICPCWDLAFAQSIANYETLADCGTRSTSSGTIFDFVVYESGIQFSNIEMFGGAIRVCTLGGTSPALNMAVTSAQADECLNVLSQLEPGCVFD